MFTEQRARWLHRNYLWLEQNLPKRRDGSKARLILPTPAFYPMPNTRDHAFATAVFEQTRAFMSISDWPCVLTPQSDRERAAQDAMRGGGVLGSMGVREAAGTFRAGKTVEITYSPSLLGDPVALVATLAHELCHYLIATLKEEPPCGWADHERLTDLAAAHEGFEVFLSNSAFTFGQWANSQHQGWQSRTQGYLNEVELGFATGLFSVRSGLAPGLAGGHLKRNPAEVYWDAIDYIPTMGLRSSGTIEF